MDFDVIVEVDARGSHSAPHPVTTLFEPPLPEGHAQDPVCGMAVDPATAKHTAEHAGTTFYFCCNGCREKFVADPARYVAPKSQSAPSSVEVRDPVCGMKVDPATAKHTAEHASQMHYFCSGGCREKFVADPTRFLAPKVKCCLKSPSTPMRNA